MMVSKSVNAKTLCETDSERKQVIEVKVYQEKPEGNIVHQREERILFAMLQKLHKL